MVQIQHQRYVFARFEVTQVDRITNMSLQSQEGGELLEDMVLLSVERCMDVV